MVDILNKPRQAGKSAELIKSLTKENNRLRNALVKMVDIYDRNNGRQSEKLADIIPIAREALYNDQN